MHVRFHFPSFYFLILLRLYRSSPSRSIFIDRYPQLLPRSLLHAGLGVYTQKSILSHCLSRRSCKMLLRMHTSMYVPCSCTLRGYQSRCFSLMLLQPSPAPFSHFETTFSSFSLITSPVSLERHKITTPKMLVKPAGGRRLIK